MSDSTDSGPQFQDHRRKSAEEAFSVWDPGTGYDRPESNIEDISRWLAGRSRLPPTPILEIIWCFGESNAYWKGGLYTWKRHEKWIAIPPNEQNLGSLISVDIQQRRRSSRCTPVCEPHTSSVARILLSFSGKASGGDEESGQGGRFGPGGLVVPAGWKPCQGVQYHIVDGGMTLSG
jgi:hypothetical protein